MSDIKPIPDPPLIARPDLVEVVMTVREMNEIASDIARDFQQQIDDLAQRVLLLEGKVAALRADRGTEEDTDGR